VEAFTPAAERRIEVGRAELDRRSLSEQSFREAALLLHTRGYVILRGAIPPAAAAQAAEEFRRVFADCVASKDGDAWYQVGRETGAVFWERNHRWRIFPKLRGPLASPWVVANPLALELLRSTLGHDLRCKFVSSDTCLRGATVQAPHRELGAGETWEPRAYVVNVPLGPCGLDNGPIEVWYGGSHLWRNDVLAPLGFNDDVQDGTNAAAEGLAAALPSRRLELELGDVVIRDPGLLHRGTVNHTPTPRSMLTACFFRRGADHSYGEAAYSLDRELWESLEPEVRGLFGHAFSSAEPAGQQ